jgi:hypothetical protein
VKKDDQYYSNFVEEKRTWYKTIGKCYCPVLKEEIFFNSKGFYHLMYDGLGHHRTQKETMYKMGLLPLVIPVIKTTKEILQNDKEYSKNLRRVVEYWQLKKVVGKQRTTVIVVLRRIGSGQINFYSVWKKDKK